MRLVLLLLRMIMKTVCWSCCCRTSLVKNKISERQLLSFIER